MEDETKKDEAVNIEPEGDKVEPTVTNSLDDVMKLLQDLGNQMSGLQQIMDNMKPVTDEPPVAAAEEPGEQPPAEEVIEAKEEAEAEEEMSEDELKEIDQLLQL